MSGDVKIKGGVNFLSGLIKDSDESPDINYYLDEDGDKDGELDEDGEFDENEGV